ncbi:hypothetical protein JZO70_20070 [Enterococcus sp. 669A]|uniref:Gram-positive cocci surface proteins LPxTG domain-containing protein n=1 Tax=Candidatus Enterococcus moelleringii TaxID=2815325 RepID=A0ABS3LFR3_9ENTE|nr:hypothetical protein [Enterococcus sp. 669A]MBO1308482.1 hypothetical protein [Enterococcus sp. 669A]
MKKVVVLLLSSFACFFCIGGYQALAAETQGSIRLEGWADIEPPKPNQPAGPQGQSSLKIEQADIPTDTPASQRITPRKASTAAYYPQTNFIRNNWHWIGVLFLLFLLLLLKRKRKEDKVET